MLHRPQIQWFSRKTTTPSPRGNTLGTGRIDIMVRELPPPHRLRQAAKRATSFMDLATAASRERDHRHAIGLLAEAENLFTAVPVSRGRSRWVAEILLRLGEELRLAGSYGESGEILARARTLAEADRVFPPRLATVLNAQGILAKDTGHYAEALAHYKESRALIVAELGEDHPALASVHHNLAGLLHAQGLFAEAEAPARHAVRLRERNTSPDPEGLAADWSVLGAVLFGLGRVDEAEQAYLRSKALWMERYGPGHYEVAVQLNGLATVLQARGDFAAAERDFREALRIKERILGPEHRETAALLNNLGTLEMDRGHPEAASRLYEKALLTFRKTLGDDHPDTVLCTGNLDRGRHRTRSEL